MSIKSTAFTCDRKTHRNHVCNESFSHCTDILIHQKMMISPTRQLTMRHQTLTKPTHNRMIFKYEFDLNLVHPAK